MSEQGVLGVASDLVTFDKHYSNVFESLLGGIVIVDNFDNAVKLSRKYRYSHRMVTLTGERISNDGSLEGGSARKQSTGNLLSYDTQISERTEKLKALEKICINLKTINPNLTQTCRKRERFIINCSIISTF